MPALRAAITQARPAARLVRDVVLEIALAGGPAADRAGTGGVPDLGQVPQPDSGVVARGLRTGGRSPRCRGSAAPRSGPARVRGCAAARSRTRPAAPPAPSGVKLNPGPGPSRAARAARPVVCPGSRVSRVLRGSWVRAGRSRAPTACPCWSVIGHAPARPRVPGRRGGQVTGQPRVDRPDPAHLARPVRRPGQVRQRHRQRAPDREPARRHVLPARARPPGWGRESLSSSRSR